MRSGRRRPERTPDPWGVLGLAPGASAAEIAHARKELARSAHPDAGGSVEAMQRLNAAAERALAELRAASDRPLSGPGRRREPPRRRPPTPGGVRQDHPSFTIEALPAEAFEGLLLAAASLGDVLDEDPPYLLEVAITHRNRAWCRLELVPDAGATTVSLTTARIAGHPTPDVLDVRDRWIDALNRVDWSELGPPQP